MEELLRGLREVCEKHGLTIEKDSESLYVDRPIVDMVNSMEDRCDISVDIGDGKDWWYVHGLATHDKVYGVNKQMCDIGKTILTKNKDIMEEKKTKKMTKAEAFEYLKGKKIMCYAGIANIFDEPTKVEKLLLEIGCRYHFANHTGWRDWYWPLYGFIVDKKGEIYVAFEDHMDFFKQNFSEPISVDDILSIEIVDENRSNDELVDIVELGKKIQCLLSKLSGHKHVVITEDDVILYDEGMSLFHSDPF